jgi:hypothetical protein
MEKEAPEPEKQPKVRRRKKRSVSTARPSAVKTTGRGAVGKKYPTSSRKVPGSEPSEHYHLNLAEIPFLTGKVCGQTCILMNYIDEF